MKVFVFRDKKNILRKEIQVSPKCCAEYLNPRQPVTSAGGSNLKVPMKHSFHLTYTTSSSNLII